MTKVLKCRDVGVDCDFVARGETEQEVMEKISKHAVADHGFKQGIPPDLANKAKAAIHEEKTAKA